MIRVAAGAALALSLAACAGQSTYDVRPFYSDQLGKMVCCEATVTSRRDVQSVTVDAVKTGDDYRIHFSETGVSSSAPISANTAAVSAVAGAVTAAANAAAQFSLKP
ncbi:hypothetical protein [Paraburkholderia sp. A3RO-2L]|uniref:hypothetical protein n=1 Tax=Paraburkholderia sp. A3RO-2L TaxID=3028376 RepID=UPI003DA7DFEA